MDLTASPNHEAVVEFDVALADVPVDIYFLLDLSGSMARHQLNLIKYVSLVQSTINEKNFMRTCASIFIPP